MFKPSPRKQLYSLVDEFLRSPAAAYDSAGVTDFEPDGDLIARIAKFLVPLLSAEDFATFNTLVKNNTDQNGAVVGHGATDAALALDRLTPSVRAAAVNALAEQRERSEAEFFRRFPDAKKIGMAW